MPDINTLLYFIAPILLLAILVPCIFLFIVYRRYVRLAKALPDPSSIQQTQPERLEEVQAEFAAYPKEHPYQSFLPPDAVPPLDINQELMQKYRPMMERHYQLP